MQELKPYTNIFWDFDGVIKNSLQVKANAFYELFKNFGIIHASKIKQHHNENLGVSRFIKIPIYLKIVGLEPTKENIKIYEKNFSKITIDKVIKSSWNLKIYNYIKNNSQRQNFYLVSATPQNDILVICESLKIDNFFREIHGSHSSKSKIINNVINNNNLDRSKSVMIGDTKNDLIAASKNNINFILSKTNFNKDLQNQCILI